MMKVKDANCVAGLTRVRGKVRYCFSRRNDDCERLRRIDSQPATPVGGMNFKEEPGRCMWTVFAGFPHDGDSQSRFHDSSTEICANHLQHACILTSLPGTHELVVIDSIDARAFLFPAPPSGWQRDFHSLSQRTCPARMKKPRPQGGTSSKPLLRVAACRMVFRGQG